MPKARADIAERVNDGALTGEDYDLMLHCTIGHMRRVDGAQPNFDDGVKALDFFAPKGEHKYIFFIFCIFCILFIFNLFFVIGRHVLRKSQPVYGFWYYYMIHRGIGVSLQKILPKMIPRSCADVDALLDCRLRVYVESSDFAYFAYLSYFAFDFVCQIQTGWRGHKGNSFDRHRLPSLHRQPFLVPPFL